MTFDVTCDDAQAAVTNTSWPAADSVTSDQWQNGNLLRAFTHFAPTVSGHKKKIGVN